MNAAYQHRAFRLWSAVTRHRFIRFGDWSPKQGRVQRPMELVGSPFTFDGDKSPAESADQSAHSKALRAMLRSFFSSASICGQ